MRIECPHCGVSGTLEEVHAGKTIRCPKCHERFVAGASDAVRPALPDQRSSQAVEAGSGTREQTQVPPPGRSQDAGSAQPDGGGGKGDRQTAPEVGEPRASGKDDRAAGERDSPQMAPPLSPPGRDGSAALPSEFDVGRILRQAWELTAGVKGQIWGGLLVTYGVTMLLAGILIGLVALLGLNPEGLVGTLFDLANSAFSAIFTAGLMLMGVHRVLGEPVVWTDVFAGFPKAGQLVVAALLQMILVGIGLMLLVLPGIYLMVGYMMTFPLMLRQGLAPWQAMETSRKAIHRVWWKMFGLSVLMMLICAISAIPFGIGLIWTLPLAVVLSGVIYCTLCDERR